MTDSQPLLDPSPRAPNDCWKTIGIWGDKSCTELSVCTHCRNCPIFSNGARVLMDRPLPAGYVQQWTSHFAERKADAGMGSLSVLIFQAGGEVFALSMRVLQEVSEARQIRTVPHRRSSALLGLVNIRGELVITVSLARLLGLPPTKAEGKGHGLMRPLLISTTGGRNVAIEVDEIVGIRRIDKLELSDVPATVLHGAHRCVSGMLATESGSVGFLDEDRLFQLFEKNLE